MRTLIACQVGNVEPLSLGVVTAPETLGPGFPCTAFGERKKPSGQSQISESHNTCYSFAFFDDSSRCLKDPVSQPGTSMFYSILVYSKSLLVFSA
jgi:hypothetical protein